MLVAGAGPAAIQALVETSVSTVLRNRTDLLDVVLDDVEQHLLEDLPLERRDRHALFVIAAQAFGGCHSGRSVGISASPPRQGGTEVAFYGHAVVVGACPHGPYRWRCFAP